jgi:CRISPR/Cas system-associated protein Csx1
MLEDEEEFGTKATERSLSRAKARKSHIENSINLSSTIATTREIKKNDKRESSKNNNNNNRISGMRMDEEMQNESMNPEYS